MRVGVFVSHTDIESKEKFRPKGKLNQATEKGLSLSSIALLMLKNLSRHRVNYVCLFQSTEVCLFQLIQFNTVCCDEPGLCKLSQCSRQLMLKQIKLTVFHCQGNSLEIV